MLKKLILIIGVIIIITLIYSFSNRSGWKKDDQGLWQKNGNPSQELPREIIEDCFNNVAGISSGLVVGDCQERLCGENEYCKARVTEVFELMMAGS